MNPKNLTLTDEQYKQALIRFREYIKKGGELWMFDSETIGDKDTQCSWGLCCRSIGMWNKGDLLNDNIGKVFVSGTGNGSERQYYFGIKYNAENHKCPMDKRVKDHHYGCFYHCRMFQGPKPNREEAIKLYDLQIERLKKC